jgi:hypothetical protein
MIHILDDRAAERRERREPPQLGMARQDVMKCKGVLLAKVACGVSAPNLRIPFSGFDTLTPSSCIYSPLEC